MTVEHTATLSQLVQITLVDHETNDPSKAVIRRLVLGESTLEIKTLAQTMYRRADSRNRISISLERAHLVKTVAEGNWMQVVWDEAVEIFNGRREACSTVPNFVLPDAPRHFSQNMRLDQLRQVTVNFEQDMSHPPEMRLKPKVILVPEIRIERAVERMAEHLPKVRTIVVRQLRINDTGLFREIEYHGMARVWASKSLLDEEAETDDEDDEYEDED